VEQILVIGVATVGLLSVLAAAILANHVSISSSIRHCVWLFMLAIVLLQYRKVSMVIPVTPSRMQIAGRS